MDKRIIAMLAVVSLSLASCIDDYDPGQLKGRKDMLVVEGSISDGINVIKLSKSVKIGDSFTGKETISTARIFVECDDGTMSDKATVSPNGYYLLNAGELDEQKSYRLSIEYDGNKYASNFLEPLPQTEITDIYWRKNGQGQPVKIYIDSDGMSTDNNYFAWTYTEHWEVHSDLIARWAEEINDSEKGYRELDLETSDNYYYCWGTDRSIGLNIKRTDNLNSNVIKGMELISISPYDDRLSFLYCIEVNQTALRRESFVYLNNIIKNTEQTGDIFSPTPAEIQGNIKCLNNPKINVIGYIDVAKATVQKSYISALDGEIYEPHPDKEPCPEFDNKGDEKLDYDDWLYKLPAVFYDGDWVANPPGTVPAGYFENSRWSWKECVDCRYKHKASKSRPSFWPNEHY